MLFREGQVFEAGVSLSGEAGPRRRWIVVSPFGKLHIHSIDQPLHTHCWPLWPIELGLANGRARLIAEEPGHPIIHLQRAKERAGIADAHLGLHGASMECMLTLLERAVAENEDYAEYAAGEILGLINCALYMPREAAQIRRRVAELIDGRVPAIIGLVARPFDVNTRDASFSELK